MTQSNITLVTSSNNLLLIYQPYWVINYFFLFGSRLFGNLSALLDATYFENETLPSAKTFENL